jgi:hypothetical protein
LIDQLKLSDKQCEEALNALKVSDTLLNVLKSVNTVTMAKFLSNYCQMGGYPDESTFPKITVSREMNEGDAFVVLLSIIFDEIIYGIGCSSTPEHKTRYLELELKIDTNNGKLQII